MSSINIYGVSTSSNPIFAFHYLYRITNIVENKHYYGVRTSKNKTPKEDLGTKYFSSSTDKEFIQDQKDHPENYKYKVIIITETRKEVAELEVYLHNKFNVGTNPKFYNKAIQTSTGFSPSGKVTVKDNVGNIYFVSVDHEKYLDGTLVPIATGNVSVRDSEGKTFWISNKDPKFLDGTLKSTATGLIPVKDSEGNSFSVRADHPDYISRKLRPQFKGQVTVQGSNGKFFNVSVDDPRFTSGQLQSNLKGTKSIYNPELNKIARLRPGESLPEGWEYGQRSPGFKHHKKTPWGIFESLCALEPEICDTKLYNWCVKNNEKPVSKDTYNNNKKLQETFGPDCIGKTYKELGFGLLTPEEYQQLIV